MSSVRHIIQNSRVDYALHELNEDAVDKNPIIQFENWLRDAIEKKVAEPYAMVMATASAKGRPSARVLLLRDVSSRGFVFYTNYKSRKGKELNKNPWGAITFFWHELQRQVRIEGKLIKLNPQESANYFSSRPRESQIGAWSSDQSSVIKKREILDRNFNKIAQKYDKKDVPCPPHWGGYCLIPVEIEFWQGRPNRLHDRLLFRRKNTQDKKWKMERLAP